LLVQVMAISVISVSSDSSEESLGTPAGRVILFCTIPTTIPDTTPTIYPATTHTDTTMTPTEIPTVLPTVLLTVPPSPDHTPALPDITPASHDYSPASDTESDPSKDPLSDHIPPLQAILPFLSSADDTTDSDTPDTPPLPTHDAMARDLLSVQASTVDSESAFSISGSVLSIRRTRLTSASLEMCICLKDHLDAAERIQHISSLEDGLDIEEQLHDVEVETGFAISLSDEEIV
ncbi:zinc finger BED domain-containing protein RICESLEEPER 2, partial [Tanacetum coccineum]